MVKVVPFSSSEATSIRPSFSRMILWAMESPSPVPRLSALGGEKGVKDLVDNSRRNSRTRVPDPGESRIPIDLRFNDQLSLVLHGIEGVQKNGKEDLSKVCFIPGTSGIPSA